MVGLSSPTTSILGNHLGQLALRVRGTARDGQIVRLSAAKCTIGSGKRCTLRLRAPGVQPVHCLILRGENGAVVRCWSPDTRLNGSAFREAPLAVGDRLSLGPVEFEVLDPDAADALTELPPAAARQKSRQRVETLKARVRDLQARVIELETAAANAQDEEGEQASVADLQELERDRQELAAQRQETEQRQRQWDAERAKLQAELADRSAALETRAVAMTAEAVALEKQKADWQNETQQSRAALDQELAALADLKREAEAERAAVESRQAEELARRLAELAEQQRQLEARRNEEETRLAWRNTELHGEIERIAADRQVFERQRQAWENERGESQKTLDDRGRKIELDRVALESVRERVEHDRAELDRERTARHADLDARFAELETHLAELAEQQAAMANASRELEERRSELEARSRELEQSRQELENRQQAQAETADSELRGELAELTQKLDAERREFAEAREQWDAQRARDQAELQAARQDRERCKDLESRKIVLEQQFQLSAQERRQAEIERDKAAAKLENTAAQLEEAQEKLKEHEAELARLAALPAPQPVELAAPTASETPSAAGLQAADRIAELERQVAELEAARAALETECQQWQAGSALREPCAEAPASWQSRLDEIENTESSSEAPAAESTAVAKEQDDSRPHRGGGETLDDVLERLRNLSMNPPEPSQDAEEDNRTAYDHDDQEPVDEARQAADDEPLETLEPVDEVPAEDSTMTKELEVEETPIRAKAATPAAAADPHEEESIEDYMSQLLNRMRGSSGGSAKSAAAEPQAKAPQAQPSTAAAPAAEQSKSAPVAEAAAAPIIKPVPKAFPRSTPPELSDLAAMRAIANTQARTAITTHRKKRWAQDTMMKGMIAAAAFLISAGVLIFAPTGYAAVRLTATFGLGTGVYFVFQAARMSKRFFNEAKKTALLHVIESAQAAARQESTAAGQQPADTKE